MRQRDVAALEIDERWLRVLERRRPRCRVARVAYGRVAGQRVQCVTSELLANKSHGAEPMRATATDGHNPGRLLTAMLQ